MALSMASPAGSDGLMVQVSGSPPEMVGVIANTLTTNRSSTSPSPGYVRIGILDTSGVEWRDERDGERLDGFPSNCPGIGDVPVDWRIP